jgi:ketosteroid isomerase-like protein
MHTISLFLLSITACSAVAQDFQREINEQVWTPFIKNFNDHNTQGFMAVHSKDVVRSPRDSKMIWDWNEYNQQQAKGDQRAIIENRKHELELRFTERLADMDQAIEVGVYRTTYFLPNGKTESYYGRFHVVLRKENGIWKILVDTDYSESNTIDEKDFLAAKPLEALQK